MRSKTLISTIVCITAGLLLALPAAAAPPSQPLAEVENLGTILVFHPHVSFAQLVLTVTGPCGFDYRQVVTEEEPYIKVNGTMIDGIYRYNLMREEKIDPEIIEILAEARKNFDPETPKELCREGLLPGPAVSQSEGFRVLEGRFVYDPETVERGVGGFSDSDSGGNPGFPLVPRDFVINDDLIVDGSACVGFDCVDGESFGFDTLRLKENNLRIKFMDTSTAASFPSNDWQLTANDSANGGANKFSIDDISGGRTPFTVEANARSHSLYVDDGGRIGSRTSTPSTELHTIDGDTPTLRLQQDGSSGFAPQTWDVAGNETNFFIRDVTNGSTLPLRIRPGASSSVIDISSDDEVGINTASPDGILHVVTGTGTNGGVIIEETDSGTAPAGLLHIKSATQAMGQIFMDDGNEWQFGGGAGNTFFASDTGDAAELILNGTTGDLTITGEITTSGSCSVGCDRVFTSEYELESIEDHAEYMWDNSHLRGVGPTPEGQPMNVTAKTEGILNELEKAHIYIERLHERLEKLEQRLTAEEE